MSKEKINLKRCPFCGGKAGLYHGVSVLVTTSYVQCTSCKAQTDEFHISTTYSSDDRAVNMWNSRAYDDSLYEAVVEEAKDE